MDSEHQQQQSYKHIKEKEQNNDLSTTQKTELKSKKKPKVNEYGSAEYWQNRYCQSKPEQYFDWLEDHTTIMQLIQQQLKNDRSKKILNIGCGNGAIQEHLYEAGFTKIVNNDISPTVILNMNNIKHKKGYSQMRYEVMDVTDMRQYKDGEFDMVFDKSTLDALTCSDDPYLNVAKMLQEVHRVLCKGGIYLVISYSTPQSRLQHLQRSHISFNIEVCKLQKENEKGHKQISHVFICHKQQLAFEPDNNWYDEFYDQLKKKQQRDYN